MEFKYNFLHRFDHAAKCFENDHGIDYRRRDTVNLSPDDIVKMLTALASVREISARCEVRIKLDILGVNPPTEEALLRFAKPYLELYESLLQEHATLLRKNSYSTLIIEEFNRIRGDLEDTARLVVDLLKTYNVLITLRSLAGSDFSVEY